MVLRDQAPVGGAHGLVVGIAGHAEHGIGILDRMALRHEFLKRGVWIRPFGNIVYTTPPLTIGREDLTILTDAIIDVVETCAR